MLTRAWSLSALSASPSALAWGDPGGRGGRRHGLPRGRAEASVAFAGDRVVRGESGRPDDGVLDRGGASALIGAVARVGLSGLAPRGAEGACGRSPAVLGVGVFEDLSLHPVVFEGDPGWAITDRPRRGRPLPGALPGGAASGHVISLRRTASRGWVLRCRSCRGTWPWRS